MTSPHAKLAPWTTLHSAVITAMPPATWMAYRRIAAKSP